MSDMYDQVQGHGNGCTVICHIEMKCAKITMAFIHLNKTKSSSSELIKLDCRMNELSAERGVRRGD